MYIYWCHYRWFCALDTFHDEGMGSHNDKCTVYPVNHSLIAWITVWWNHIIKQSPSHPNIQSDKLEIFCHSMPSFYICNHNMSCSPVRRISIDICLINPFQLRFYCLDAIPPSIIAYYSNLFSRSAIDSTLTGYEHALKTSLISSLCWNPPWCPKCIIVWMMSWWNGVCSWHFTSHWWL